MTHYTRADLEMADRHIAESERHILDQEALLTLRTQAAPTGEAEKASALFKSTQTEHLAHRTAIAAALKACGW